VWPLPPGTAAAIAGALGLGSRARSRLWRGAGGAVALVGLVQVHPMEPTLNAPRTKRLKLYHDKMLSILLTFCFQNFNLHHYTLAPPAADLADLGAVSMVGRCRLTL